MTEANQLVMSRSVYFWIATAAVIGFNSAAAVAQDPRLVIPALVLTGLLALGAIVFGIWAALKLRKSLP